METVASIFDGLLALTLIWLAWQTLASPDFFKAIVFFVAFGLLMALAWVRLDAPDIALAEAAIGAGLTGALLLSALARLNTTVASEVPDGQSTGGAPLPSRWPVALVVLAIAAGLACAVLALPPQAAGLSGQVAANLDASGVGNPVTAVLLNFRGYDTLLETFVLLLALLGCRALGGLAPPEEAVPGPILDTLSRLLAPGMILVAAYLLWAGTHGPGGAFQAGSVLGAAGVLLLLAGWRPGGKLMRLPLRLAVVAGPGAFVAVAALTLAAGGRLLEYSPENAALVIVVIETLAGFSIGVTLAALFLGVAPQDRDLQ